MTMTMIRKVDPYSVWSGRRKRSFETYENAVDLAELLAGT